MKKLLLLLTLAVLASQDVLAWGRMGHDAIAYIAECNLTPKARKRVEKILGNRSIVYYASWMDDIRDTPPYKHTTTWHTAPVTADLYYDDALLTPKGNVIYGLELALDKLSDWKSLDDSTLAVSVRQVVHMMGDMHCPGHAKLPDAAGKYDITLMDKPYTFHSVLDTHIVEHHHKWYYTEWQHQLDRLSRKQKQAITEGGIRDWFHDTALVARKVYDAVPRDSHQGKDFLNEMRPVAEQQILKAGYRLAKILNEIFG